MMLRLLPLLLLAATFPATGQNSAAVNPGAGEAYSAQVKHYVKTIERAFYRSMAVVDASGRQPSAFALTHPFHTVGNFAPREQVQMSWSLSGVTEDISGLCVSRIVANSLEWGETLYGLSQAGLRPAAQDCGPARSFPVPAVYPATLYAVKTLDRRDVPTPTMLPSPGNLVFSGVTTRPAALPGLQLSPYVGSGYADIVIHNPAVPATCPASPNANKPVDWCRDRSGGNPNENAGGGAVLTDGDIALVSVRIRDGFTYVHNCDYIAAGDSCLFRVRYEGLQGDFRVGNLRLDFSNGSFAVISLLGRTK